MDHEMDDLKVLTKAKLPKFCNLLAVSNQSKTMEDAIQKLAVDHEEIDMKCKEYMNFVCLLMFIIDVTLELLVSDKLN